MRDDAEIGPVFVPILEIASTSATRSEGVDAIIVHVVGLRSMAVRYARPLGAAPSCGTLLERCVGLLARSHSRPFGARLANLFSERSLPLVAETRSEWS